MGNILNTFFASVFTKEELNELQAVTRRFKGQENEKLCSFTVTSDMVKSKLLKLKMNKTPGTDLVGTRMLLELAELISVTVAELFNKLISLKSGDVPQDWKMANVTAAYNKGKKSSLSNYRPVSLSQFM